MRRRIKALLFFVGVTVTFCAFRTFYTTNHNPMLNSDTKTVDTTRVSPQTLYDKTWQTVKSEYYDPNFNHQHWGRWKNRYDGKIQTEEDAKVAIETMLASLDDPYSRFLTKEEFSEQNTSITSKISGIGVNIINDSGKIRIISVIENTPAQFADVHAGDIILAIDGKKVSGLSLAEVSNLVKGPTNTFVSVKSYIEKNIGYIQISSFISNSTPNEFLEALENTNNSQGLIVDLRGNTGGLLTNAVFVANLFIEKGRLVSIVGRNGYRYDVMARDTDLEIKKPVIVLVNGASASASEILSGALKDYHKAKIIGTKTYGKGMVQKIIPLPNETGLNLTIAKYLTPKGKDINKKGISPDIEVDFTQKDISERKDVQLETAKYILEKMIAKK